jgi:hypothetical protein
LKQPQTKKTEMKRTSIVPRATAALRKTAYLDVVRRPIDRKLRIGFSPDLGYAVVTDSLGNATFTGVFQGSVDFGGTSLASAGAFDGFLLSLGQ